MKVRVRGIWGPTIVYEAESVEQARRWYHGAHPGFTGGIMKAEEVPDDATTENPG